MSRRSYSQIKPNDLSKAIHESLIDYTDEVQQEIDEQAEKISTAAAKQISESSPKRKGKYAKGWRVKRISDGSRWHSLSYVVHNATDYQLTHLLENDHALRNGGRSKPIKHIAPAEEIAVQEFMAAVEKAVKR